MGEQNEVNVFRFTCRGCTMQGRERVWRGFVSSCAVGGEDNSYLTLVKEPTNRYDPNAIKVVCRGEFFGTVGYVAKEQTVDVKKILDACRSYHVDMVNVDDVGARELSLILTWKD